ncbi:ABC transporter ATP-binding protein [Cellulosimicrobium sp. CUA-896]|uniref:ABC transporter ATP-binding protein n=1 Tax=Cellulosimicrobium sp. CUA-896 TaxID=1517881 RepID=UPI000964DB23|nr:ABC transporter ATP-binding protein [Cellulosimicrobium sp. CUA-896]OLT53419.1 ABC transporter ATP-binding protein [Cellulosimicrobium sp. CUA-896]
MTSTTSTTGTTTAGRDAAPAVEIHDLHKRFGAVRALDGLDLTVRPGEVAGFLGPNGAGKSTTIRVLLGLLRADSGSVRLLGGDPWTDAVALHRRLAYVPGDVTLWPNLTGGEAIDLLTRLRGAVDPARRKLLLERFELDPTKKARTYSKGNRQKVALVAALASDVELLVLDEPTSGLDPLMEAEFTECVREVVAEGRSVLLSSHILAEVEKLCDTVTIIRAGRAVQSGTLAELRHLTRSSVTVVTERDPSGLGAVDGVHDLVVERTPDGPRARFDVDNDRMQALVAALGAHDVRSLHVAPPSLEELFMRHYGDEVARLDRAGAL